jgi:hypothetical protein
MTQSIVDAGMLASEYYLRLARTSESAKSSQRSVITAWIGMPYWDGVAMVFLQKGDRVWSVFI